MHPTGLVQTVQKLRSFLQFVDKVVDISSTSLLWRRGDPHGPAVQETIGFPEFFDKLIDVPVVMAV